MVPGPMTTLKISRWFPVPWQHYRSADNSRSHDNTTDQQIIPASRSRDNTVDQHMVSRPMTTLHTDQQIVSGPMTTADLLSTLAQSPPLTAPRLLRGSDQVKLAKPVLEGWFSHGWDEIGIFCPFKPGQRRGKKTRLNNLFHFWSTKSCALSL